MTVTVQSIVAGVIHRPDSDCHLLENFCSHSDFTLANQLPRKVNIPLYVVKGLSGQHDLEDKCIDAGI